MVSFAAAQCTPDAVRRLKEVLAGHTGVVPVHLEIEEQGGQRRIYRLGDDLRVERRAGLFGELKSAFGPDAVQDAAGERSFGDERDEPGWRRSRRDADLVGSR